MKIYRSCDKITLFWFNLILSYSGKDKERWNKFVINICIRDRGNYSRWFYKKYNCEKKEKEIIENVGNLNE